MIQLQIYICMAYLIVTINYLLTIKTQKKKMRLKSTTATICYSMYMYICMDVGDCI